jgi:hypothetical protein
MSELQAMSERVVSPNTYVNYCHGDAFILEGNDVSACADCEWFGTWGEAPEWLRDAILAEYAYDLEMEASDA